MIRNATLLLCCFLLAQTTCVLAYWQQRTDVSINVLLDDQAHMLHGFESLKYVNQSPDTLHTLIFHLWPNAYKNDRTAFCEEMIQRGKTDFYYARESERGWIDSLRFRSEGLLIDYKPFEEASDIIQLELNRPLPPGDSIVIETPFRVKIPRQFSRLGHSGNAYFISQWFPKPAVYDSRGWHPLHYLDQGEFFSEFGSYEVAVTLPENYVILATGQLQDERERQWLDSLSALPLRTDSFYRSGYALKTAGTKTVHFSGQNIHDFAWFADKRWIVRATLYEGPAAAGPVKIYTACLPAHRRQWKDAPQMVRFALEQYGTRVGPYPYPSLGVVEGDLLAGGGMEYPGVALIDRSAVSALSEVIFHEVGHNWFYGTLASDERSFPWMDEGMNSYYERLTQRLWQQQHGLRSGPGIDDVIPFYLQSVQEDQPAGLPAPEYRYVNYGGDIYAKVPLLFESVAACNGTEEVDSMFREYYRSFRFRHPYPADFDTIFARHFAAKGFSSSWLHASLASDQPLKLSIRSARSINHGVQVRLQNKSDIATTALLQIGDSGLLVQKTVLFPAHSDTTLTFDSVTSWKYASIAGACTDYSLRDNSVFNRLFRRKGVSIGPGFGLQRTSTYRIFAAPVPLCNIYDGRSVGIMLHNLSFPLSRFQFIIAPVFSMGSERMNGVAGLSYSWYPRKSFLKEIRLQTDLKTFSRDKSDLNIKDPLFARYFKEASALEIVFRNKDLVSPVHQHVLFRHYHVYEQGFGYSLSPADSLYRPYLVGQSNNYFLVKYAYQNRQTFHPYSYAMQAELGATFVKLGLEARKRIDYDLPHKSLYLRAYAGKFFDLQNTSSNSRYWLNSTFTGKNDYLYDALFTGRSEISGFSAAQLYEKEGGAKTPTNQYNNPLGRSGNWLLALNLSSDLPLGKLPLRAYLDVQTTADAKRLNPAGNAVSFQSGLELHLIRDLVHVYMPLLLSSDYQDYLKSVFPKDRLLKSVTFSVQITDFNWMRTHERLFGLLVQ